MKVDQETGEILEQELPFKVKEGFVINDQSSFEWVMEKIQREESEINCLKQQKANLEAMIKRQESNLAAIHYRFDNELIHYAKENSDGKKVSVRKLANSGDATSWAYSPEAPRPCLL